MINKSHYVVLVLIFACCFVLCSACGSDTDKMTPPTDIEAIEKLVATATDVPNQLLLRWKNADNLQIEKLELTYRTKSITGPKESLQMVPKLGHEQEILVDVPFYGLYVMTISAYDRGANKLSESTVEARPAYGGTTSPVPVFLQRADILMESMYRQFMMDRNYKGIWRDKADITSGMAALWGQGSALSGYTAIRRASQGYPEYLSKYAPLADELFDNGIESFKTVRSDVIEGLEAYACFPGAGNERFYDDDVWIALDMVDMYEQTRDQKYLERVELIWRFLMSGNDMQQGGGIYWKEQDRSSKNTCSTAPTAVMAAKLYLLTQEEKYKEKAIELYKWLKVTLQDPADYLFFDNINIKGEVSTAKFSYNAGQPMQAAVLLYKITNDEMYLRDAQNIAASAFRHWFKSYDSPWLEETIFYIDGHTWFNTILLRGYIELYRVDGNRTYINAYEQMLSNLWLSELGHNRVVELLNYNDFTGLTSQNEWEILHIGACVEMLAQMALLESEGI